ncbi:unnamed protein product [Cercopithifilaria johnstoni]|uniref:Uncharacterized protein n=1 Tax=Cercopithifilaria johnstoni TaxID=2874296 RepID=A0A8J2M5Q3_9BILA|nr:unnamed protein product [Cercopithifilaria johnstoni]
MEIIQNENKEMKNEDKMKPKINGLMLMQPEKNLKVVDLMWMESKQQKITKKSYGYDSMQGSMKCSDLKQKSAKNSESFFALPTTSFKESNELLDKNIQRMLDVENTPPDEEQTATDLPEILLEKNDNHKAKKGDSEDSHSTSETNRSETGDTEESFL